MTPLEKIKKGIKDGDMGLVCSGYNAMTGEKTKAKASIAKGEVSIADLISELQNMIDKYGVGYIPLETEPIDPPVTGKKKRGRPKGKKNAPKKKKDAVKIAMDGEDLSIVEGEIEATNALGGKKMTFVGAEFNEEDHQKSIAMQKMGDGKKRASVVSHDCEVCRKNEGSLVTSDNDSKYICNDCLLSAKRK